MPDKLIPGEKKTPVYKKSGFKMKGWSPFTQKSMRELRSNKTMQELQSQKTTHGLKSQKTKLTKKGESKATNTSFGGGYTFDDAFATARKQGFKTFDWKGKSYHTKTKEEV
jgi:hypothetical protein